MSEQKNGNRPCDRHCRHPFEDATKDQGPTVYYCCRADCLDVWIRRDGDPVEREEKTHGGPIFCTSAIPTLRFL